MYFGRRPSSIAQYLNDDPPVHGLIQRDSPAIWLPIGLLGARVRKAERAKLIAWHACPNKEPDHGSGAC